VTLKDQARAIEQKLAEIQQVGYKIGHLCELVRTSHELNGETFEFSDTDKQKMITLYQTRKTELKALVDELP